MCFKKTSSKLVSKSIPKCLDVNQRSLEVATQGGASALHNAVDGNFLPSVQCLLEAQSDIHLPLGQVCKSKIVKHLPHVNQKEKEQVPKSSTINCPFSPRADQSGRNVLVAVADAGQPRALRWLLERSAELALAATAADLFGRTAVYAAAERGHDEVLQMLLEAQCNVKDMKKRKCWSWVGRVLGHPSNLTWFVDHFPKEMMDSVDIMMFIPRRPLAYESISLNFFKSLHPLNFVAKKSVNQKADQKPDFKPWKAMEKKPSKMAMFNLSLFNHGRPRRWTATTAAPSTPPPCCAAALPCSGCCAAAATPTAKTGTATRRCMWRRKWEMWRSKPQKNGWVVRWKLEIVVKNR